MSEFDQCQKWSKIPFINPLTGHAINPYSKNGIYHNLSQKCSSIGIYPSSKFIELLNPKSTHIQKTPTQTILQKSPIRTYNS